MSGFLTTALQLAGIVLGLWWLRRAAQAGRSDRFVAAAGIAVAAAMAGFLYLMTPLHPDTSLIPHLNGFPPGLPEPWYLVRFWDFLIGYWPAGQSLLDGPDALRAVFERFDRGGFVNVPITAYAFVPFTLFGERQIAGIVYSLVGLVGLALTWRMVSAHHGFDRFERAGALLAMACYGPLIYSVREGNLSHFLLPGIVWGISRVVARRDFSAGLLFGALTVVKPLLGLVGVYLLLRGRMRAVLGGIVSGTALLGLSLAIFGWDMHVLWYEKAIAPYAHDPLPAINAQSIASFIARFETGLPGYTEWYPHVLNSGDAVLVKLLSIALLAVFAWAALAGRRHMRPSPAETECELHLTLVAACLISTLCWSHYYTWLLPAAAYVYARSRNGGLAPGWRAAAVAGFLLMAPNEYFNLFVRAGISEPLSNFVVSYRMFGALLLFAVLVHIRRRCFATEQTVAARAAAGA